MQEFKRFAVNVWDVSPEGKTDEQIAAEGLSAMEVWMREIGLVMNARELGVTEEMLDGIAQGTFLLEGGYKVLRREDVVRIVRESVQ